MFALPERNRWFMKKILALILLIAACDGTFRVKKDIEIKKSVDPQCIRNSIVEVLPKSSISETTDTDKTSFLTRAKIVKLDHSIEVVLRKSGGTSEIELKSYGIIGISKQSEEDHMKSANELLETLAKRIKFLCGEQPKIK